MDNDAQTPWDGSYRPPIYGCKAGQFKSFPKSATDIIFLGDSVIAYGHWNELLSLPAAKNRGIPGDTTFGVMERLQDVIDGNPAKILVFAGFNDIIRNIPVDVMMDNFSEMIGRIKTASTSTAIYLQTLTPVNDAFIDLIGKRKYIIAVNNGLKDLAEKENVGLIDLHSHFLDDSGNLDEQYTFDGLHMNDLGYFKWVGILKESGYL